MSLENELQNAIESISHGGVSKINYVVDDSEATAAFNVMYRKYLGSDIRMSINQATKTITLDKPGSEPIVVPEPEPVPEPMIDHLVPEPPEPEDDTVLPPEDEDFGFEGENLT